MPRPVDTMRLDSGKDDRPARLDEIKEAAVKNFYEFGYDATDLRRIASDINLHPSTFYYYVESKQHVLFLIIYEGLIELNARLDAAVAGATSARDAVRAAIACHLRWCAEKRHTAWTHVVELRRLEGEYRERAVAERDKYDQKWQELLEWGVRDHEFRPMNVKMVNFGLVGMLWSIARWYKSNGPTSVEGLAESWADMVLRGLLTPSSTVRMPVAD